MYIPENRQIVNLLYLMKQKRNYFKWGPKKQIMNKLSRRLPMKLPLGESEHDVMESTLPRERRRSPFEGRISSKKYPERLEDSHMESGIHRIWALLNPHWKRVLITLWRNLSCFRSDWHESKASPGASTVREKSFILIMPSYPAEKMDPSDHTEA